MPMRWSGRCSGRGRFFTAGLNAGVRHFFWPLCKSWRGPAPFQLIDVGKERRVGAQRRQVLEQQRVLAVGAKDTFRERFNRAVLVEQSGRRARANSSNAWITILRISHQCEIVGYELRIDAEFCAHSFGVPDLHSLADDLDDAVIAHALCEILVVGPDANLLDPLVPRGEV